MSLTIFTDFGLGVLMQTASEPDRAFSTADLAHAFALSQATGGPIAPSPLLPFEGPPAQG